MIRTTLTLDDDLARSLHDEAQRTRQSFRAVVNTSLRRGLQRLPTAAPSAHSALVLPTHSLGLGPELASTSANKLNDLLETEHFTRPHPTR